MFFWLAGQGGYGIQSAPALAHLAAHLVSLAIDLHVVVAFDQLATQRAPGLVADDGDTVLLAADRALQVVQDAAAFAHARGREDDALADIVESAALVDAGYPDARNLKLKEECVRDSEKCAAST